MTTHCPGLLQLLLKKVAGLNPNIKSEWTDAGYSSKDSDTRNNNNICTNIKLH